MLTKDQIRSYRDTGYVVVENVLPEAQIAEGRRIIRRYPTTAVSARIPLPGVGNAGTIYELQTLVREKGFTNQ